jgi:hypothetical protein
MTKPTPEQLAELSKLYNLRRATQLHYKNKEKIIEEKQSLIYAQLIKEKEAWLEHERTVLIQLGKEIIDLRLKIGIPDTYIYDNVIGAIIGIKFIN